MRVSVAVGAAFLAVIAVESLVRGPSAPADAGGSSPWPGGRRGVAAVALVLVAAGIALQSAGNALWVDVTLDWLPGVYLLACYWLPGSLTHRPAPRLQAHLEEADRVLFQSGFARFLDRTPRLFLEYLEAAYLSCYFTVPAGLAWLYLAGHRREADAFWTAVLLAALPTYLLVAWFETQPPRRVEAVSPTRPRRVALRALNVAVLDRVSIGVNTFPSGHVAASLAVALAVGAVIPWAGVILGVVAVSIAVGSIAGRYHYALDAASGALAAALAFAVSRLV